MTLVELLVVLVVIAAVLALAMPSFSRLLARKQVEGVFNELQTDLQLARSSAVSRGMPVRMTFGSGCYVVHTHPAGAGDSSCSQGGASTMGANSSEIKTTQLQAGSATSIVPQDLLTWIEFDSVRGTATWSGSGATGAINVGSAVGNWQLQANILATGRVQTCSPGGSLTGFTPCGP
jgi:type IV fimbrial biogenesis protein FimT